MLFYFYNYFEFHQGSVSTGYNILTFLKSLKQQFGVCQKYICNDRFQAVQVSPCEDWSFARVVKHSQHNLPKAIQTLLAITDCPSAFLYVAIA
ncbi:hypothetical protein FKM82_005744 [Ascaphus truei]